MGCPKHVVIFVAFFGLRGSLRCHHGGCFARSSCLRRAAALLRPRKICIGLEDFVCVPPETEISDLTKKNRRKSA